MGKIDPYGNLMQKGMEEHQVKNQVQIIKDNCLLFIVNSYKLTFTDDKGGNKGSKIQQDPYAYSLSLEAKGASFNVETSSGLRTDELAIRSTRSGI